MKTKRNRIILSCVIAFLLLLTAAAVYIFGFYPAGYRMTVPYRHAFERIADGIYVNKDYAGSREEIIRLTDGAKERDREFFGELLCPEDTVIIICDDDKLLSKLGGDHDTVTWFFPVKKHYTSVSDEYLNIDILAHELTHAELHTRMSLSAYKKIPTWFDEGVATQNDYREQYSEEEWVRQTDNGKNALLPEDMDTPAEFYAGTAEDRRFRYLNAKHEVAGWLETHGREGLFELTDRLNGGEDFNAVYG